MITHLEDGVRRIVETLGDLGTELALIGGLAISAHTEPRFTRDVDLALSVSTDREAEQLVVQLRGRRYAVDATVEQTAVKRLATVRLVPLDSPDRAPVIDLLFASSGIEVEIVNQAEPLEVFPGLRLPVARVGHLLALKLLARADDRPQDTMDLQALLKVATPEDLQLAHQSLQLITERGFHRNKDLREDWEALVAGDEDAPG